MCSDSRPDSGPVPAIIVFSLTEQAAADRKKTAHQLLYGIWSTLQAEDLVRHRPVEVWRPRGVEDSMELHVLFRSQGAATSWLENPVVKETHGDALESLLGKPPETRLYHDTGFDEDEYPICQCSSPTGLLAEGCPFERRRPLTCLDCGGQFEEPDPEPDADAPAIEDWTRTYAHIERIWVESMILEHWSAGQLSDPASELNTSGRAACAALEEQVGVPVYLLILSWDPESGDLLSIEKCPACSDAGVALEGGGERRFCGGCRLAFE